MKAQPALEKRPARSSEAPSERPAAVARRRDHIFHTGMAVAISLAIVGGFARTYYLRPLFGLLTRKQVPNGRDR